MAVDDPFSGCLMTFRIRSRADQQRLGAGASNQGACKGIDNADSDALSALIGVLRA
jgi:hypothetical protein